ncbi:MAG: hypothetical protein D6696_18900 [Acidobacteria bacterium]|nr:MAG: hypothetical protein D6696_18900 [Acidobacteriota bacterium]
MCNRCSTTTARAEVWALLAALVAGAAAHAQPALTAEEEVGRRIYFEGRSSDDPAEGISALLGGPGGTEVPAWTLPCAGCHGEDGEGGTEGGISPSNITWPALTKPYGVRHDTGRQHPPYTESTLKRAITMGIDPAGNPLHVAMPRYRLTHAQAAALVAYLKRLGTTRQPGVDADALRLGVVLPPAGRTGPLGEAVRSLLAAWAAQVNDRGGVYNRRLELRFLTPPEPAEERRRAVAAWLDEEDVFALIAPFMVGADGELAGLMAERAIPAIGAFSVDPQLGFPLNRYVFYLLSGYPEQGRALVDFAAARLQPAPQRVAVIFPDQPSRARAAAAIRQQGTTVAAEGAWAAIVSRPYPPAAFDAAAVVESEQRAGTEAVFFLGDEADTRALLAAAAARRWRPYLLLVGPLAGNAVFAAEPGMTERVFVAFPTLPGDRRPAGLERFEELVEARRVELTVPPVQLAAYSAAELLLEGLERAGRDLTREALVAALEGLYRHRTYLTPDLTYGPNRRIGALGAYVAAVDVAGRRLLPQGDWVTPR